MAKDDPVSPTELGPVTRAEVGCLLRVSLTTVDRWKKNGCPMVMVARVGHYPLHELVEWRIERARATAERDDGTTGRST